MPFGPQILWPLTLIRSTRGCRSAASAFPNPCAASTCRKASDPESRSAIPAIGCWTPVSLLTCITETSSVSGRTAAATRSASTRPPGSGSTRVSSKPRAASTRNGSSTAWCSIVVPTRCVRPSARPKASRPSSARLFDSVAPLVKITSLRRTPATRATCARARSTACRATRPWTCVRLPALPKSVSLKRRNSACTRGSMGQVAAQSRYTGPESSGACTVDPDCTWNTGAATAAAAERHLRAGAVTACERSVRALSRDRRDSMHVEDHGLLPPGRGLAFENEALRRLESSVASRTPQVAVEQGLATAPRARPASAAHAGERLLIWESARPAVILPRCGEPNLWVRVSTCTARGIPLLHRESGGGAVVVGPGCLNFALVLSLEGRPWLEDVERSYGLLLAWLADALAIGGIAIRSTDLAIGERKFAGHAQRRVRGALLHHGVLLYDFDPQLVDTLLPEPPRRPAWRGNRTHREFLTNAPLARDEIVRRLRRLPALRARCTSG